jgi:hypothetical protein
MPTEDHEGRYLLLISGFSLVYFMNVFFMVFRKCLWLLTHHNLAAPEHNFHTTALRGPLLAVLPGFKARGRFKDMCAGW